MQLFMIVEYLNSFMSDSKGFNSLQDFSLSERAFSSYDLALIPDVFMLTVNTVFGDTTILSAHPLFC